MSADAFPAKPVLKWAGGKTRLLSTLRRFIPRRFGRYVEPFLGGGALFFDLAPEEAIIADANPELISFYEAVRDKPDDVLSALKDFKVNERAYYHIRDDMQVPSLSPTARAARFLYLNKTCYNGLYRVNKAGQFNTPFGKYTSVTLADPDNLRAVSAILKRAELTCDDYQDVLKRAKAGDFVYLDPPYLPVGKYSDFKRYTKECFYEENHRELAKEFSRLDKLGCHVLLSNSYHPTIAALYEAYIPHHTVMVPRFVNCKGDGRGRVKELLIANYSPEAER